MLTYYYKTIRDKHFKEVEKFKKGVWVYVENPTAEEQATLIEDFKLDEGLVEDALDIDEVPRFESEDGLMYIYTRFPFTNQQLQIVTVPVLIVLGDDLFLSISKHPLPRLEKMKRASSVHTTQRIKLLLQVLDAIVHDYERHLNTISKQILATRNRLRVERIRNRDFIQFVNIEDELNEFMSALQPTNTIIKRLLNGRHFKLYEEDEDLLEDLLLSNAQSIENCKSSIKTIVSIREAYSTIATNNLNQIIRFLTSMTVILTVPTIIASIYGMNVQLPLMADPNAFWIIIALTVTVTTVLLMIFRKQDWL